MDKIRIFILSDCDILRTGLSSSLKRFREFTVIGDSEVHRFPEMIKSEPDIVFLASYQLTDRVCDVARGIKTWLPCKCVVLFDGCLLPLTLFECGVDGYCTFGSTDNLAAALKSVSTGAVWLDKPIADLNIHEQRQLFTNLSKCQPIRSFLSTRETEVCELVMQGMTNQEIAGCLGISVETVKTHVSHIMAKAMVKRRSELRKSMLLADLIERPHNTADVYGGQNHEQQLNFAPNTKSI